MRWHDRLLWGLLIAVGVAVTAWAALTQRSRRNPPPPAPSYESFLKGKPLSDFQFLDQFGRPVTRDTLAGKVWILGFGFTRCQMSCPHLFAGMQELQKQLNRDDILFVTLTVDPEYDTATELQQHACRCGEDQERRWYLTGGREAIHRFMQENFHTLPQENAQEPPERRFSHSNHLMLIDRTGSIQGTYRAVEEILTEENVPTGTFRPNQPELTRLHLDAEQLARETAP
jgi:cytochrome oxidase Cu insertion factor (SCO1/SenC/PrrC family)